MAKFVSLDRLSTFLEQVKVLLTGKVNTSDLKAKTKPELETIWTDSSVPDIASQLTEIESVNATKIANEITRAKAAEEANAADISANAADISTNATDITNLTTKVDGLFAVVSTW